MKILKVLHDAKIILVDLEVNIGKNKQNHSQHYVQLNIKEKLFL